MQQIEFLRGILAMGVLKIDLVFIKYSAFFSFEFLSNGVYA